jgi:ligand-binding SRPBCC domain-containing protein
MSTLRAELWLPKTPAEIFPFFADAHNLAAITPSWLEFTIVSSGAVEMKAGAIIDYRLRVHGLPLRWRSEITLWQPPFRFRDEQRRGPYRRWVHTHSFVPHEGGTLCLDEVDFTVPGGRLIERLFVRRDVRTIFEYRQNALYRRLAGTTSAAPEISEHRPWRVTIADGSEDGLPDSPRARV